MKSLGRKVHAESGGKPDVESQSNEFAGVPSIGRESDDNAKPYPDSAWKSASQQEIEKFLPGFIGKVNK